MDFHGAAMNRTWLHLEKNAVPGDKIVVLPEPVTGWRVGDEVLLTGAKRSYANTRRNDPAASSSETHRITKIEGLTLHLDKALSHEHLGEVANLSRKVIIESADPNGGRGHTMYHRHCAGGISYARFALLGQEGLLGRYPIHHHLCGATMRGSSVIGVAIVDSHNRWVTIHGTHFLVVRDCVRYQSIGHAFFLEDASEVYNLLDRNLGVQAYNGKKLPKQVLPFDPNDGAAFWWSNGRNSFTRNTACENEEYGYPLVIAEVDEKGPALKRKTVTPIDDRKSDQGSGVQFSNFSLLEDRVTHELVLVLTTYGQEADPKEWATADGYRYALTIR